MYPLSFLFGLGFDTTTEIGLIGISAAEALRGLSIWSILIFPGLSTSGMTLIDTTDSVLMIGAYGWAFLKPIRKLYYNLAVTAASVVVALVVGNIETLGLIWKGSPDLWCRPSYQPEAHRLIDPDKRRPGYRPFSWSSDRNREQTFSGRQGSGGCDQGVAQALCHSPDALPS
jgi:hypothetical protein